MQRIGRRNDPAFRLVVTEHTSSPQSGKYVEKVGTYNPKTKETAINDERVKHWISVGAQPSDTVHNMLVKRGLIKAATRNVLPKKTPIKSAEPEIAAPAAAPTPAPAAEAAPAEVVAEAETTTEEATQAA